jgi:hypothetical protein
VTIAGLTIDVATHVSAGGEMPSGAAATAGHLLTLLGMMVAVSGLVSLGVRTARSTRGRRS